MNALEKYATKRKLAMGLSSMLMGLAGKLGGGHRPMGQSSFGRAPSPCGHSSGMGTSMGMGMQRPPMGEEASKASKVLDSLAAQAISMKKKIDMGQKLSPWATYKVYKAGDCMKSAMASTFTLRPKLTIIIKRAAAQKKLAGVPQMGAGSPRAEIPMQAQPIPQAQNAQQAPPRKPPQSANQLGQRQQPVPRPGQSVQVQDPSAGTTQSIPVPQQILGRNNNSPSWGSIAGGVLG